MELTPESIALLKKVRRKIKMIPGSYVQAAWVKHVDPRIAPCKTAACIAGWTCMLSGKFTKHNSISEIVDAEGNIASAAIAARELLNLDQWEASILFSGSPALSWPHPFDEQWEEAQAIKAVRQRREALADIAYRYLTRIIKTGKIEA